MAESDKTCFVVMGFGIKTDFLTGRSLDLDKSYRSIIKPAVEEAGLQCIRADEIIHSGSIDLAMYRHLLEADVVVADISTCNANALYELGVRHALRPFTTVTIAEDQITYPFDVSHIVIRRYKHLGQGIDFEEAVRFRTELTEAIRTLISRPEADSPVYGSLAGLRPPALEVKVVTSPAPSLPDPNDQTLSVLCQRAEVAMKAGEFEEAKALFGAARALWNNDHFLTQQMALATYKSGMPTELAALQKAKAILSELDPEVCNDPETLGLWGAVHKRLWKETKERVHLDTAIRAYQRGFDIRTDYYNGINLAFLFNMRARTSSPAEQIADFVMAERVRREVIKLCDEVLAEGRFRKDADRYWVKATLAEAYLGIGDEESSQRYLREAEEEDVADWMRQSTAKQLAALRDLLVPSPLAMIQAPAGQT
ncbi:MAG: TRAFs-binding domain-containing protein [Acidimicrobiales bacterium]